MASGQQPTSDSVFSDDGSPDIENLVIFVREPQVSHKSVRLHALIAFGSQLVRGLRVCVWLLGFINRG